MGDSLFSKPRYEAMTLLAALSQRTKHVKLGTACVVVTTRNPLWLALEWATLDHISGGRTIFGACMGNPEKGVRREFEAVGLPFKDRATIFEEILEIVLQLWTEKKTSFKGKYFNYDEVEFSSGTEMEPLAPIQQPPPRWIVSNPRLVGDPGEEKARRIMERRRRPHHPLRRRLDDLLPRRAPRGAHGADRLPRASGRAPRARTSPITRSPTRSR